MAITKRFASEEYVTSEVTNIVIQEIEKQGGTGSVIVDAELSTESENPVQNKIVTAKFTELQEEIDDHENRIKKLESNTSVNGSGVTIAQANSLWNVLKKTAFAEMLTEEEKTAFKNEWGITEEEPDTPDEPIIPEVTLSSISATYSGGNVTAGTSVNSLTGITVTARYSDGSTTTVTGYTLSGTIVEGSNTITVSYGGKTTTFTVTGVAESSGGESGDSTDWEADVPYTNYNWIDGKMIHNNSGAEGNMGTYSASDYIPCKGVSTLTSSLAVQYGAFYDDSKNFISNYNATANAPVEVPSNAAWFRFSGVTDTVKTISIIPDAGSGGSSVEGGTEWEDGVPYSEFNWEDGFYINGNGIAMSYNGLSASDYMPCNGVSTIEFVSASDVAQNQGYSGFYTSDKTFITGSSFVILGNGHTSTITIPDNAVYFRFTVKTDEKAKYTVTPHA